MTKTFVSDQPDSYTAELERQLQDAEHDRRALRDALNLFEDDDAATIVASLKKLNSQVDEWAADAAAKILDHVTLGTGLTVSWIVKNPRF